ncbi:MAG: DUF393 domain-containing protein [Hyphomicrobium sp.]|nr:MAG: DUF393 domain-containing protein [Hyphomicrobium sp.]
MPDLKSATQKPIVYFDGSCPLCRREIGYYRSKPGADNLAWTDVSACEMGLVAEDLSKGAAMSRFHVRDANGRLMSGAAAFAELWTHVPGWRWAGRLASSPIILPLLEIVYRGSLVVRPAMQRLAARRNARVVIPHQPE